LTTSTPGPQPEAGPPGRSPGSLLPAARPLWNHNIHYHRVVLEALPVGAEKVLDVGCGEGYLCRDLAVKVRQVVGVDRDGPSIDRARRFPGPGDINYVVGDLFELELAPASFDLVACVAALHHMDMEKGLLRMAEMLKPGGALVIVGLARPGRAGDYLPDLAAMFAHRYLRLVRHYVKQTSPVLWPPPLTYDQVRVVTGNALPGACYRRHLLWRYSLVWVKPA
jgi:2-polyprenyl-3-methyl-5-hydroxy-6-metoxy-1,4-benzoquinol methylase